MDFRIEVVLRAKHNSDSWNVFLKKVYKDIHTNFETHCWNILHEISTQNFTDDYTPECGRDYADIWCVDTEEFAELYKNIFTEEPTNVEQIKENITVISDGDEFVISKHTQTEFYEIMEMLREMKSTYDSVQILVVWMDVSIDISSE